MAKRKKIINGMQAVAIKDAAVQLHLNALLQDNLAPDEIEKINLSEIFEAATAWKKRTAIIFGLKVVPLHEVLEKKTWTSLPSPKDSYGMSVMNMVAERDVRNRTLVIARIAHASSDEVARSLQDNIKTIFEDARNNWKDDIKTVIGSIRAERMFAAFEKKF